MSDKNDKRKRSREDDEACESTPLSKRINNLHLYNVEEAQYNQQLQPQIHNHMQELSKHMMETLEASSVLKPMTSYEPDKILYQPELDESQNPFYFNKNKVLHDLHMERLKRSRP